MREKGRRYERLDLPFVVAVNCMGTFADFPSIERALYGDAQWSAESALTGRTITRDGDSAWTGPGGPVYTRVTAVLATRLREPFHIASDAARMYVNPWARKPCTPILLRLPSASLGEEGVTYRPGDSLALILGLPSGWLVDDPLAW